MKLIQLVLEEEFGGEIQKEALNSDTEVLYLKKINSYLEKENAELKDDIYKKLETITKAVDNISLKMDIDYEISKTKKKIDSKNNKIKES